MKKELAYRIQEGYDRIDRRWLTLHYRMAIGLVLFCTAAEGVLCYLLSGSALVSTSVAVFYARYWIIPSVINLLCIAVQTAAMRTGRLKQNTRKYIISFTFTVICFVLFTVHIIYAVLYFLFVFPVVLTIVYADYKLTACTAVLCVACVLAAELLTAWDPYKISIWDDTIRMMNFCIGLLSLLVFYGVCMVVVLFERKKNADSILGEIEREQLVKKLQMDELTGVYSRNALCDALKQIHQHPDRLYILVMMDMDNFKAINDTQGHVAGDRYLAALGKILISSCTKGVPFRYGGDEFSILFENCCMDDVVRICKQIQKELKAIGCEMRDDFSWTASMGIAEHNWGMDAAMLISNADQALYQAKRQRNAICIYHREAAC